MNIERKKELKRISEDENEYNERKKKRKNYFRHRILPSYRKKIHKQFCYIGSGASKSRSQCKSNNKAREPAHQTKDMCEIYRGRKREQKKNWRARIDKGKI